MVIFCFHTVCWLELGPRGSQVINLQGFIFFWTVNVLCFRATAHGSLSREDLNATVKGSTERFSTHLLSLGDSKNSVGKVCPMLGLNWCFLRSSSTVRNIYVFQSVEIKSKVTRLLQGGGGHLVLAQKHTAATSADLLWESCSFEVCCCYSLVITYLSCCVLSTHTACVLRHWMLRKQMGLLSPTASKEKQWEVNTYSERLCNIGFILRRSSWSY